MFSEILQSWSLLIALPVESPAVVPITSLRTPQQHRCSYVATAVVRIYNSVRKFKHRSEIDISAETVLTCSHRVVCLSIRAAGDVQQQVRRTPSRGTTAVGCRCFVCSSSSSSRPALGRSGPRYGSQQWQYHQSVSLIVYRERVANPDCGILFSSASHFCFHFFHGCSIDPFPPPPPTAEPKYVSFLQTLVYTRTYIRCHHDSFLNEQCRRRRRRRRPQYNSTAVVVVTPAVGGGQDTAVGSQSDGQENWNLLVRTGPHAIFIHIIRGRSPYNF